jgi:hypothetical protein
MGQQVFNCSDGLLIAGSRPKASVAVKLASTPEGKARDLARLMNHFPPAEAKVFRQRWTGTDWLGKVRALADRIMALCDDLHLADEGAEDGFWLMGEGCRLLITDFDRLPRFEEYFLRGSALSAMMAYDYYLRRVHPAEQRARFRRIARDELVRIVATMVRQSEWFFDNIDDFKSYEDLENRVREWTYD